MIPHRQFYFADPSISWSLTCIPEESIFHQKSYYFKVIRQDSGFIRTMGSSFMAASHSGLLRNKGKLINRDFFEKIKYSDRISNQNR